MCCDHCAIFILLELKNIFNSLLFISVICVTTQRCEQSESATNAKVILAKVDELYKKVAPDIYIIILLQLLDNIIMRTKRDRLV